MVGYSADELQQMNLFQLLDPSTAAADREKFQSLGSGGSEAWIVERRCLMRDGSATWVRACFGLIPRMEDSPLRAVGMIEDIDERRRLETELRDQSTVLQSLLEECRRRDRMQAKLARHLIRVSEQERKDIARALHDELGNALAAISMDVGWIGKQLKTANPGVAERQARLLDTVRATLDLKRRLVDRLLPLTLEHFGLDFAVRAHCEVAAGICGIPITVTGPEQPPSLDPRTGLALFRVLQECLANVEKHAMATQARVSIGTVDGNLLLRIEDDGVGIPDHALDRADAYGLAIIRERMADIGGTLSIRLGATGKGTVVLATVPIAVTPATVAPSHAP